MKTFPFIFNKPADYLEIFNPKDWINFILEGINPALSLKKVNAEIIRIIAETKNTKTLVLRKLLAPTVYKSGQHVPVTVEINGKRITRYYSISSSPMDKNLKITVKRQDGGLVSNYIHDVLKQGNLLEIGDASGNFVLPEVVPTIPNVVTATKTNVVVPTKFLFIAGGSGITPIYSMLKTLYHEKFKGDIKLIYFSRTKEEIIFYHSLLFLERQFNFLKVEFILTDEKLDEFRNDFFSKKLLDELVPNYANYLTYLCGPETLQREVKKIISSNNLISENFQPFIKKGIKKQNKKVEVTLSKSHRKVTLNGNNSILEELEQNGIYPQNGCRMGICHTCTCTKKSGVVLNIQDNSISESMEETIQLCITKAEENLVLEL